MKFRSRLTEATLLRRSFMFLGEVALPDRKRMMIRCPNLGDMGGYDILGSEIWFSIPSGQHALHTWELIETDGGHMVGINPELARPLVVEAINNNIIPELQGYNLLQVGILQDQRHCIDILLEKKGEQCFVAIEHVISSDGRGEGYFPENMSEGLDKLNQLNTIKQAGHKAILFFCVCHTGVESVRPADHIDPLYGKLLRQCVQQGVEVLAYRAEVSPEEIKLSTQLPVLLSEGYLSLK